MKLIFLLLIFLNYLTFAQSQDSINVIEEAKTNHPDSSKSNNIKYKYVPIQKKPEYKGGIKKLKKDLSKKVIFDKSINGNVLINFKIGVSGKSFGFVCLKGISNEIDNEIILALKNLQFWVPAINRDEKIETGNLLIITIKNGEINSVQG